MWHEICTEFDINIIYIFIYSRAMFSKLMNIHIVDKMKGKVN